jgi:hypothetical protein
MPKTVSNYVLKVYSTTLAIGITLGVLSVYLKDLHQHSYNDAWDNPFANLILFWLVGIGMSLVPFLVFAILTKLLITFRLPVRKIAVFLAGLGCTALPFYSLYYSVNEGYHRVNVIIYAVCFLTGLCLSFFLYRGLLASLGNQSTASNQTK